MINAFKSIYIPGTCLIVHAVPEAILGNYPFYQIYWLSFETHLLLSRPSNHQWNEGRFLQKSN